jgi:hypothetical protein
VAASVVKPLINFDKTHEKGYFIPSYGRSRTVGRLNAFSNLILRLVVIIALTPDYTIESLRLKLQFQLTHKIHKVYRNLLDQQYLT